jgi:Protein of unknown function (DUF3347)
MRKVLYLIIILGLGAFVAYKLVNRNDSKPVAAKEAPLAISKNSAGFNASFSRLLTSYYALQKALVNWDTLGANLAAKALQQSSDSLLIKELQADSSIILTAQNLAASISGEAKGLIGDNDIALKRRDFNMLTDELYSLVRTVRYDRAIVFHMRCPMAFGDSAEGFWLSNTNTIINPYLGNKHPTYAGKMVGCGEIVDSLDFAQK